MFTGKKAHRAAVRLPMMILMLVILASGTASSQSPGVTDTEILLGQSCALIGPHQLLGQGMRDGALTYFRHVNEAGGINGRKIRLISMDDGYEPNACIVNTTKLIDGEKVFLLFGYTGAITAEAAAPIAIEKKIPFFSPATGAQFLRIPENRYVFTTRPGYLQEIEALIEKLISEKGIGKIAVFYQNDDYGKARLETVRRILAPKNLQIISEAPYERNTNAVAAAGRDLLASKPEAVIMIGTYAPCARLISMMKNWGSDALFATTSFVDADTLGRQLSNRGLGVIISQVVPYPYDRRVPLVAEYHRLSGKFSPGVETGFIGLEGFLAAKALCLIIKSMEGDMTRENFIKAAEGQAGIDLGGVKLSFNPQQHQGITDVFFTQVVPGGFIKPLEHLKDLYN